MKILTISFLSLFVLAALLAALPGRAGAAERNAATGDHQRAQVLGKGIFRDCPDCPEMVVIPAGSFVMGSPPAEPGRFDSEGPRHRVSVRWFALAKYDVTVEQFAAFVHETGYEPDPCAWPSDSTWDSPGFVPKDPVVCVSWRDAKAYIAWLNRKIRPASAGAAAGDGPYRLPSEAEWEYAARAGTSTARWWGEDIGSGNANCHGCGSPWDNKQISPIGSFAANAFGLYDMLGDVWQWTADCWNESYASAPTDGRPWASGDCRQRVLRGGSWSNLPNFVRAAARTREAIDSRNKDYATYTGFRVAMSLP